MWGCCYGVWGVWVCCGIMLGSFTLLYCLLRVAVCGWSVAVCVALWWCLDFILLLVFVLVLVLWV